MNGNWIKRVTAALIFALVILSFTSISVAQDTTATATNPNSPLYAAAGPYSVGRTWFKVSYGAEKPLILMAWYPAVKPEGDQAAAPLTVPDEYQFANIKGIESSANWGPAKSNAAPDSSSAPYPLVIFSPGYGRSPKSYISLGEHLASYGFIVITDALAPDKAIWSHYIARPMVTSHMIDFAEGLSSQDGSFKGLIDTKHIGVAGESSGGYTALAAGGAQFDLAWFENWCTDYKDSPDAQIVCPDLLGHKKEMVALANLDSMPQGLWPSWGDPRVSAIVSQSGDAYVFGPSGLASVTIPVMVQVGSKDSINTPEWSAYLTYDNVSSSQKVEVVFDGANHFVFADGTDGETNNDLINHFTTAFLLDVLKGDPDAHKALLPDAVNFSGIEYKTTLK